MHKIFFLIVFLLSLPSRGDSTNEVVAGGVSTNRLRAPDNTPLIAEAVVESLTRMHVSRAPLDDTISERALEIFLDTLDPDHSYFLEPDLAFTAAMRHQLDDQLRAHNVDLAYDLFAVFKQRVHDRSAFVTNLVYSGFDLNIDENYWWNRKDEPWPRNESDWNELWRKKIKNEYVGMRIARDIRDMDRAEKAAAATNVIATVSNAAPVTADAPDKADPDEADPEDALAEDPDVIDSANLEADEEKTIEEIIASRYERFAKSVDEIESQWVLDQYLTAFCHGYDPHCDYMSPAAAEEFNIEMSLSLVGIGAVLSLNGGATEIMSIIPGGPADRDKRPIRLVKGDRIIAVGQGDEPVVDIRNWPLNKIVRLIRGETNTIVKLTVIPVDAPTDDETKIVDLVRDEIKLEDKGSKKHIYESHGSDGVKRKVGVISVPAFYGDIRSHEDGAPGKSCAADVERLLLECRDEEVEGVILNLRSNSGGSLREAGLMTGLFIPQGPVVIIKDEQGASVLPDVNPALTYGGPLVILVNRHTASAGEILAGALQDYGRAIVVGDSRTHGKGTVQTVKQLGVEGELGSIKVTNAQFYRITGSSTQLKGVTSDIWVPSPFDYTRTGEERLPYALQWSMTQRARFRPFAEITSAVREINRLSEKRLAESERFVNYTNMLVQFEAINLEEELPLNLEVRRERALMRNKLKKAQEEFPEAEDDVENDLVLSEALHVVSDLITLTPFPAWPELAEMKEKAAAAAAAAEVPLIEIDLNLLDKPMRKRLEVWVEALESTDEKEISDTLKELETLQELIRRLRSAHPKDADPGALNALKELLQPAD